MNDFDDLLRHAWQAAQPSTDSAALIRRVRRHRLRLKLRRALEIAITLGAVAMLLRPLAGAAVTPAYWLVMPFFVVYMPAAWWLLLRASRAPVEAAALDVSSYARVRLTQLRTGLRELRITRVAVLTLLGYAGAVVVGAFLLGDAPWREAASQLLLAAAAWSAALLWFCARRRRHALREYRAMRRLT
ncbi:hypothetical protein [Luteimonas terrae]|uniref:Uncharacterized protein n=1 Tax=Luteimonas terrae TaxID=1530191 RepID=A0ABU1XSE0_9GAMM|nr:hypothetical protein [Luteimonas terrae]MDR7191658.1 hypothetical protein [Luteimonas terrae]